jgi:hypothetical protein
MTALAGETCGQVGGFALDKSHETGGISREQRVVSRDTTEQNRISAHGIRLPRMALLTACTSPKMSGD